MLKRFIPTVGAASLMICTGAFAQNETNRTNAGVSSGAASEQQQQQQSSNSSEGREGHQQMHQLLQSANTPDKLFIVGQAVDNKAEIELAQLAQQKAENQQVKQVAQQIMQDHQKLGDQLKQVAQQENLQIPESMQLPPMKQQEKKVMESLSGQQFDQAYICAMKAGHAAAVSKYEDVSKTAQDGAVKQFASEALPSLQRHFQMINTAAQAVGLTPAGGGSEAVPAGATLRGSSGETGGSAGTRSNDASNGGTGGTSGRSSGTSGQSSGGGTTR